MFITGAKGEQVKEGWEALQGHPWTAEGAACDLQYIFSSESLEKWGLKKEMLLAPSSSHFQFFENGGHKQTFWAKNISPFLPNEYEW